MTAPLPNETVLAVDAAVFVVGYWGGVAMRPTADGLRHAFEADGYTAWFVEFDNSPLSLFGLVVPWQAGTTAADVLRVMGHLGATAGGVWSSEATVDSVRAVQAGADVGELVPSFASMVGANAEAASQMAGLVAWLARNWILVAAAGVAGYLLWKGRA
jgi:hypothetical protein